MLSLECAPTWARRMWLVTIPNQQGESNADIPGLKANTKKKLSGNKIVGVPPFLMKMLE